MSKEVIKLSQSKRQGPGHIWSIIPLTLLSITPWALKLEKKILKSNTVRMKNFSMPQQFRTYFKKSRFNEDLSKGVNPNNFSDKLSSINYFINMYSLSSILIRDLKPILYIIMNTVKYRHDMTWPKTVRRTRNDSICFTCYSFLSYALTCY